MDISQLLEARDPGSHGESRETGSIAVTNGASAPSKASYPSVHQSPTYGSPHNQPNLAPLGPASGVGPVLPGPHPQLPPVSSLHPPPPPHQYHHEQHQVQPQPIPAPGFVHSIQPYYPTAPPQTLPAAYGHHSLPPLGPAPSLSGPPSVIPLKRSATQAGHHATHESPPKKMGKWTPEEDALAIELRRKGMKWEDISKRLPGRSAISCRLRYQNYSEKRPDWDEEKKNKLARLYNRFKKDMWDMIAKEMGLPWRAVEAMHWQMGCEDMASRANVPVFQPHVPVSTKTQSNISNKSKGSRSPPAALSDSSIGGGPIGPAIRASGGTPGATSTRSRRSSSAASRRRMPQDPTREFASVGNALMLPSVDEQAMSGVELGHDSGGGSISGREGEILEREGTGTSLHSQPSHRRSRSLGSGRSAGSGEGVPEPFRAIKTES